MDERDIIGLVNLNYDADVSSAELLRKGGNLSYALQGDRGKYFLKVIRQPFLDSALRSVQIQMFLQQRRFPVVPIILSGEGNPLVRAYEQGKECFLILLEFIEGCEPGPEDTEKVGEAVGRLHKEMKEYSGQLPARGRHFFVDRYVEILRRIRYPKSETFREYGDELWERVKGLPRGYCHSDLHRGNIHKSREGSLYVVDFDTSCSAFPIYDAALFCNDTDYFDYDDAGLAKSRQRLDRFLAGYSRNLSFSGEEASAFTDMIALYHFQLQATILEMNGYGCCSEGFFDRQLDWLLRWKEQSRG